MMPIFVMIQPILRIIHQGLSNTCIVKKLKYIDNDWNFTGAVNENLGSYWTCIQGMDQKRWFAQEIYNQKKLQFKKLSDHALMMLSVS